MTVRDNGRWAPGADCDDVSDHVGVEAGSPVGGTLAAATVPGGLLTAEDVAHRLAVKKSWVYAEARAGRIPHVPPRAIRPLSPRGHRGMGAPAGARPRRGPALIDPRVGDPRVEPRICRGFSARVPRVVPAARLALDALLRDNGDRNKKVPRRRWNAPGPAIRRGPL